MTTTEVSPTDASSEKTHLIEFRGRGGEYFKIWIVNILLSIVTLYIYSAWAKVRTNRYFYGNTYLADGSFEYHAKPMQILKGRIIAVVLLILVVVANTINPIVSAALTVLILLATPWIIWRSLMFNARMSSYRNVRFNFTGQCGAAYLYVLVIPMIPFVIGGALVAMFYIEGMKDVLPDALTFTVASAGVFAAALVIAFLMYPLTRRLLLTYAIDNAKYGTSQFKSNLSTSTFYKIYLKTFGLSLLIFVSLVVVLLLLALLAKAMGVGGDSLEETLNPEVMLGEGLSVLMVVGVAIFYALILGLTFLISAYLVSRMRNYVLSNTTLANNKVKLASFAPARSLWWLIFSNFLLLLVTLGLAYPWTRVRSARFYARHTSVTAASLDGFLSEQIQHQSSIGEEMGDAFDVDIGLGI